MYLKSITLRNYRLHRELTVYFDVSRTLVGGPNEIGKSTLAEAMHRVLFLKAKGNTELHRAMKSTFSSDHPEVELEFEADGRAYQLKKRFGPNGETTLNPANSKSLSGTGAEAELARVLNVEAGLSGKAALGQWAHLWVLQGQSSRDPSVHATNQRDALVTRLQNAGASAVMESDLDAKVAAFFAGEVADTFTKKDKPKSGSDLDRAVKDAENAKGDLDRAQRRVVDLDQAAVDVESASDELSKVELTLGALREEQKQLDVRAKELAALKDEEFDRRECAAHASRRFGELQAADRRIVNARKAIETLEQESKPQNERVSELEESLESAKRRLNDAEYEHRVATEAVREVTLQHDLASAHRQRIELAARAVKLEEKTESIKSLQETITSLEADRAEFPDVDEDTLATLRILETEVLRASTALRSMAAGLEVLSSDQAVIVNGSTAAVGQRLILAEDTDIDVGQIVKLRVTPGGGTTLAEAKQMQINAEDRLGRSLEKLGIETVQEAADACARRKELASRIENLCAELEGIDPNATDDELNLVRKQLNETQSSIHRRMAQFPQAKTPQDAEAADTLLAELKSQLNDAETHDSVSQDSWDQSKSEFDRIESELVNTTSAAKQNNDALFDFQVRLNQLLETYDADENLHQRLEAARTEKATAEYQVTVTKQRIEELLPELLDADRQRVARALEQKQGQKTDLRSRIAVARAALRNDGHEDPQSAYAIALVKSRIAAEHRDVMHRKANALTLLDRLFQEEQRSLADRFTQPLAEKFTDYLRFVFGPTAKASVNMEKNQFTGLQLSRPSDGTFDFSDLSGGAREQLAAAVRLAMAEVLAADHDGCLPIVFDDAFACSDPVRIQGLQRMLDLAATRGLQVIVLTCNPEEYGSLGASQVKMRKVGPDSECQSSAISQRPEMVDNLVL